MTDNNPLTYVLTSAKLDATGHWWLAALLKFSFNIQFRDRTRNQDADGLSRRLHTPAETDDSATVYCEVYGGCKQRHISYRSCQSCM